MANRYTRLTPSTFNPLSLQEIFTVPLARQKQHDEAVASIDELGLFDINSLDQDRDAANQYINNFQGDLDKLSDQIMKRGIDNLSKRQIMKLAKDRDEWLKRGEGSKIVSNYNAYKANVEDVKKQYEKGDILRDKYILGIQQAKNNYKGVAEGDTYSPFSAVKDTEYLKYGQDIAKAISDNPKTITSYSPNLQYNEQTGKYVDVKTTQEYTQEGAIKLAVQNGMMLNPEIMSDLNQRKQLGILGDQSIPEYLNKIATQNEFIYRKDNLEQSKQYIGVSDNRGNDEPNPSDQYQYAGDVTFEQKTSDLSTVLDDIINKRRDYSTPLITSYGTTLTGTGDRQLSSLRQLTPEQSEDYARIVTNLQSKGVIPSNMSKEDEMKAVQSYLGKFSEITFRPVKYTNGLYKTYTNQGSKVKPSTPKDLAAGIALNPEDYMWLDPESKEELKFEDLPDDQKEFLLEGKGKVSGVFGARNFLSENYPTIKPEKLASPQELQLKGNKKYIVSRSSNEMETNAYKGDIKVNEIWRNISFPNVDYNTSIPGLGDVTIYRSVETDDQTGYVTKNNIKIITSEGKEYTIADDNHLEEIIGRLYSNTK